MWKKAILAGTLAGAIALTVRKRRTIFNTIYADRDKEDRGIHTIAGTVESFERVDGKTFVQLKLPDDGSYVNVWVDGFLNTYLGEVLTADVYLLDHSHDEEGTPILFLKAVAIGYPHDPLSSFSWL